MSCNIQILVQTSLTLLWHLDLPKKLQKKATNYNNNNENDMALSEENQSEGFEIGSDSKMTADTQSKLEPELDLRKFQSKEIEGSCTGGYGTLTQKQNMDSNITNKGQESHRL